MQIICNERKIPEQYESAEQQKKEEYERNRNEYSISRPSGVWLMCRDGGQATEAECPEVSTGGEQVAPHWSAQQEGGAACTRCDVVVWVYGDGTEDRFMKGRRI